jgi:hypothetical protein
MSEIVISGTPMGSTAMPPGGTGDGVTVVLPAYREEGNLAGTVEDMLGTLAGIGERHVVVVVNDGSSDRTGDVADDLAARYPGRVHVVHHEVNKGYGAAVRTGIATALEHTDSEWLFLTDSDGQFRAEQLPEFLSEAKTERADAVIGFRPYRADPTMRKVNAWLWTQASRVLLGVGARDVDCAYKLISRRVLDGVPLHGDAALISPEVMMRIRGRGARVLQRPVNHYPRLHGEQTGAKLSVILVSLIGLLGLWRERMSGALPGRVIRAVARPRDGVAAAVAAAAVIGAIVTYLALSAGHAVLTSHAVLVGTAGWGGPWYLASLPALAISMLAYTVATCYLYRAGLALTRTRGAAVLAAAAFAASPAIPALRAVPMEGLLLAACAAAVIYHLTVWCQSGSYRQLAATATAALLAALAGSAGWGLDAAVAVVVWSVAMRDAAGRPAPSQPARTDRLRHAEAHLLFYAVPALTPVVGWLAWNWAHVGSPLHFARGAAAAGFGTIPGAATAAVALVLPALLMGYLAVALPLGWATARPSR